MPQLTLPRPKLLLQNAASLPRQVLPTAIGRPLSSVLSNLTDSLPDIALPATIPTPPLPQGLGNIPSPRDFVAQAETVLPAGAPRLASFVPNLRFTRGVGVTSDNQGQFRPLQRTSTASNGHVRTGGYRSI